MAQLLTRLSIGMQMGTVISHASKDRISQMVDASVSEGATILTGGDCPGEGTCAHSVESCGVLEMYTMYELDKCMNSETCDTCC